MLRNSKQPAYEAATSQGKMSTPPAMALSATSRAAAPKSTSPGASADDSVVQRRVNARAFDPLLWIEQRERCADRQDHSRYDAGRRFGDEIEIPQTIGRRLDVDARHLAAFGPASLEVQDVAAVCPFRPQL